MKIGTIICNHWASKDNPSKYFIYTGIKGHFATGVWVWENTLKNIKFYKEDFEDADYYEPVGFCNAFEIMKNDLNKFKEVKE